MTRHSSTEIKPNPALSEADIAGYLKTHPDFFQRNETLLLELNIPHKTGPAISLIERQVTQLRLQQGKLQRRIADLVQIARENDEISARVQQFTLKIVECADFEQTAHALRSSLEHDFILDAVFIRIAGRYQGQQALSAETQALFVPRQDAGRVLLNLMQIREPVCGQLNREQMRYLFEPQAAMILSAAVLPLSFGVIALGSKDEHRFHPSLSTHFLKYLAQIIEGKIKKYVDPNH